MPSRPCPQARGRARASSGSPPQAAPARRDHRFPECAVAVELAHPRLREVPGLLPYLVLLAHDRTREPHQRARGGEHLHDARPALYLSVGSLLHVVGAQALPVGRRKVEVNRVPGRRADSLRIGRYTNFLDNTDSEPFARSTALISPPWTPIPCYLKLLIATLPLPGHIGPFHS